MQSGRAIVQYPRVNEHKDAAQKKEERSALHALRKIGEIKI